MAFVLTASDVAVPSAAAQSLPTSPRRALHWLRIRHSLRILRAITSRLSGSGILQHKNRSDHLHTFPSRGRGIFLVRFDHVKVEYISCTVAARVTDHNICTSVRTQDGRPDCVHWQGTPQSPARRAFTAIDPANPPPTPRTKAIPARQQVPETETAHHLQFL